MGRERIERRWFAQAGLLLLVVFAACGGEGGTSGRPDAGSPDVAPDGTADVIAPEDAADDGATDGEDAVDASGPDSPLRVDVSVLDSGGSGADAADIGPDVVFEPDGVVLPDSGEVAGLPRIDEVVPNRGPAAGGTEIVVYGANFTAEIELLLNGSLLTDVDFVDAGTVIARTPPNPQGVWPLKVVDRGGVAVLADAYTYLAPVVLGSVEPVEGPTRGGFPVVIRGSGFSPGATVSFDGRLGAGVVVESTERIRVFAPASGAGPADVRVTGNGGSATLEDGLTFYEEPRLTGALPAAGPVAGGTRVRIEGVGLDASCAVSVDGADARVLSRGDGWVEISTPAGAPGIVDIAASCARGASRLSDGWMYLDPEATDGMAAVIPSRGRSAGGDVVFVAGVGLDDVDVVRFGDAEATIVSSEATGLVVRTPPGEPGEVAVTGAAAGVAVPSSATFTYREALGELALAPSSGPVAGGTEVTLEGIAVGTASSVRFGFREAPIVRRSAGSLVVTSPANVSGSVDVTVASEGETVVIPRGYRYTSAPSVTGLSPSRGSVAGGTWVWIRGSGLESATGVTFGGTAALRMEIVDDATLGAVTPPGERGSVEVRVIGETGEAISPDRFSYFDSFSGEAGWGGESILGAVNVTVLNGTNGRPIEEAFVTLSVRSDELRYTGVTNEVGQVTISAPDLSGRQTVHATALKFSSSTVQSVDASNVVVILSPICGCWDDGDCWPGETCSAGTCVTTVSCEADEDCGGAGHPGTTYSCNGPTCMENCQSSGDPPPPPPFGIVQGTLRGLDKIEDPSPGEVLRGVVYASSPSPSLLMETILEEIPPTLVDVQGNPNSFVVQADGPYALATRIGEQAIFGLCGTWNEAQQRFTPKYMAVRRRLEVQADMTHFVELSCDIHLDRSITFKVVNSPVGRPSGPNWHRSVPYLYLGQEGYFAAWAAEGVATEMTGSRFPRLDGPLTDATYFVMGGAVGYSPSTDPYTSPIGGPVSVSLMRGVRDVSRTVQIPALLPTPEPVAPRPFDDLTGRRIEWRLSGGLRPDFQNVSILKPGMFQDTLFWEVTVPGTQTVANLAFFPEDPLTGPFPPDPTYNDFYVLSLLGVKTAGLEWDRFSLDYYGFDAWESYTFSGWLFYYPGD